MNALRAWEVILALSRPMQPYDTDRRAALERILRLTEEESEVHAASEELREVARLAVTAVGSQEMRVLTGTLARIYTIALLETARLRQTA